MDSIWKYEMGLYQTTEPVFTPSLGGKSDVWFDIEEEFLSKPQYSHKQKAAWDSFCKIDQTTMRQLFVTALLELAQRMKSLPDDAKPGFGPTIHPEVMENEARKAASTLKATKRALLKQLPCVFQCGSIVVPVQNKAIGHFVIINFEIAFGNRPNRSYGYELEALFYENRLLFIAENSGLWTRTDWAHNFNTPDFTPHDAIKLHPYWRGCGRK